MRYRDIISQTNRQIQAAVQEREALEEQFQALREEGARNLQKIDQNRQFYDKQISNLKDRVNKENASLAEASSRLFDLSMFAEESKQKDLQINQLRAQVRDLQSKMETKNVQDIGTGVLQVAFFGESLTSNKLIPSSPDPGSPKAREKKKQRKKNTKKGKLRTRGQRKDCEIRARASPRNNAK